MKETQEKKGITLDFNYMMSDFIGDEFGICVDEIDRISERIKSIHREIHDKRKKGFMKFLDLPYEDTKEIERLSLYVRNKFENFIVFGIGGSALGGIALHKALNHPFYNMLSRKKRNNCPKIFFADNIDPEGIKAIIEIVDLKKTAFNIISKSGETTETLSQFLYIWDMLNRKLGKRNFKNHIIITTNPEKGPLREIVKNEDLMNLNISKDIGGRFSALSSVGLFPSSVTGINIRKILKGAAYMDTKCRVEDVWKNPALMNACLQYIAYRKGLRLSVMMPYADCLYSFADWYRQLWAECLGKKQSVTGEIINVGLTPIKALGATDQHSQIQLYMEGPYDKTITFLVVDDFKKDVQIPKIKLNIKNISYLQGHTMKGLLNIEKLATEFALMKSGRSSCTIKIPERTPFTIGGLIYMFELQVAILGALLNIDPFNQPGIDLGKFFTFGIMGREGYTQYKDEFENKSKKLNQYIISV